MLTVRTLLTVSEVSVSFLERVKHTDCEDTVSLNPAPS